MALQIKAPYEIAIVGNEWREKLSEFHKHYLPDALFMGGATEGQLPLLQNKLVDGKTMIYVCENKTCKRPVETVAAAMGQVR